jgi:hypothetical protein
VKIVPADRIDNIGVAGDWGRWIIRRKLCQLGTLGFGQLIVRGRGRIARQGIGCGARGIGECNDRHDDPRPGIGAD